MMSLGYNVEHPVLPRTRHMLRKLSRKEQTKRSSSVMDFQEWWTSLQGCSWLCHNAVLTIIVLSEAPVIRCVTMHSSAIKSFWDSPSLPSSPPSPPPPSNRPPYTPPPPHIPPTHHPSLTLPLSKCSQSK
jgi:hypothetical protein